jgi:chemotaxis response regulator CheB
MRFVLCDDDLMMRSMVDGVVTALGHEVIGVADTTSEACGLVRSGRPDAVVVDIGVGSNTDFDVVASAIEVGAQPIVFSFYLHEDRISSYAVRPLVVAKPDFTALEETISRLSVDDDAGGGERERRKRPTRAAEGPVPMGPHDAQAFYEALNNSTDGDTLVAIELVDMSAIADTDSIATRISRLIRETDRLLVTSTSLKILLPGGGTEGTASLLGRLSSEAALPPRSKMHSVVIGHGEAPGDAFDRLKHALDAG